MEEQEISYQLLRKIQETEKKAPTLTELYPEFYESLSEYLQKLEDRAEQESSNQKEMLIKEEIQNLKKIAIGIYELREKKIILAAISNVRGGTPDLKNMVNQETELYESVLDIMKNTRKNFLKIQENPKKEKNRENNTEKPPETTENTNPILRIKETIPEFVGTDTKKYNLRKNDVISISDDMATMLEKRDVAKKIKSQYSRM
jgi:DNA replication initiation complex subunit (GINS family)